jgi:hypothetical protein
VTIRKGDHAMPALILIVSAVLAACSTAPSSSPPDPTTEEKIAREVERAQDATIRDMIGTMRRETSRAIREIITGR